MAQTPALMHKPNVIDYTPGSDVIAGQVVVIGTIPMIAPVAIASGVKGVLNASGIWKVPQAAEAITAGDAVYWDADGTPVTGTALSGAATGTSSANNLMGVAIATSVNTDTYVYVMLTAAKRTATIAGAVTATDITGADSTLTIVGLSAAQGGLVSVTGALSTTSGNAGGAGSLVGGVGGATGAGGAAVVTGGASGATSGTGGAAAVTGGAAGSAAGNAIGGAASVTGGIGKGNLAGGAGSLVGGVGGLTGAGGAIVVTAGAGGATSGTGGAVVVAAGDGTNGDADGGAMTVRAGNAEGSGTDGVMSLGATNTSAITIAATSIPTTTPGPINHGIGASTAAAGSTAGDATTLPAATAPVYPTTAADDTKGVIIHADDKVTGRELYIGNGAGANILKIYPPSGGNINGLGANVAYSTTSGGSALIKCLSSGSNTWFALG